jgi:hypothetical protein
MKNDLVGMFLIVGDDEGYRTAEIVAAVGGSHYLVQFNNMKKMAPDAPPLLPLLLYAAEELSQDCDCGLKKFNLFRSRADMNQWIAWLDQPSPHKASGKVVHLKH